MDAVTLHETEDLALIEHMAGDHEHINRPTANPSAKTHYLAMQDGERVGTGWIRTFARKIGVIGGMYIEDEYRGQGLGEELFDALCKRVKRRNCRLIVLGVHRDNRAAISLYRKKGFRTIVPWVPGVDTDSRLVSRIEAILSIPFPPRTTKLMVKVV
jgi:ribosomal protein S18 acetylase RimI-like enzyme